MRNHVNSLFNFHKIFFIYKFCVYLGRGGDPFHLFYLCWAYMDEFNLASKAGVRMREKIGESLK